MRRVAHAVLMGGVACILAACAGEGPTAPDASSPRISASRVSGQARPLPLGSCQYTDPGTGSYPVIVSWSGQKVTRIDVRDASTQPLSQTLFKHSGKKGSLSLTEAGLPASAEIFGTTIGMIVPCTAG